MRNITIIAFLLAFIGGAVAVLVVRGGVHDAVSADSAHTDHESHGNQQQGAAHVDQAQPGAAHGDHGAAHGDHGMAPPLQTEPAPAEVEESAMVTVYFCEGDERYGLSYASSCPLDGEPMIPRRVDRAQFNDLENPTCPVCGMDGRPDLFAIYGDELLRLGCPACDGRFFADPERYLSDARAQPRTGTED